LIQSDLHVQCQFKIIVQNQDTKEDFHTVALRQPHLQCGILITHQLIFLGNELHHPLFLHGLRKIRQKKIKKAGLNKSARLRGFKVHIKDRLVVGFLDKHQPPLHSARRA